MSIYWINVMATIHDLSQWPLFVSFVTTVSIAALYFFAGIDKECDLRACKICEKALAYTVPILLVSSVVYVMSSPIK